MKKSFCFRQEASANALDLSRDSSQVVIVGRNLFRVLHIGEDRFSERLNLRLGKNLNLSYSSIDVAWNRLYESQLATAAANGQVVLWDLNMPARNKQLHSFVEHRRSCNKVTFHPSEPHLLVSGSQDGSVKLFDMRRYEPVMSFIGSVDSVRDVQFSGRTGSLLAAVTENGQVLLWERSRPDRCVLQMAAHFGPAHSCRWHPTRRSWITTVGRDKTLKVWQLSDDYRLQLLHSLVTTTSVGGVAWRPLFDNQLVTSAQLSDSTLSVWDLARPFVPYATLAGHSDVVTCVAWRDDPHSLLSAGRDGAVWLHQFREAQYPALCVEPYCLAIAGDGSMSASFATAPVTASQPPPAPVYTPSQPQSASPSSQLLLGGSPSSLLHGWLPLQRADDVLPAVRHSSGTAVANSAGSGDRHSPDAAAASVDAVFYGVNSSRVLVTRDRTCELFDAAAVQYRIDGEMATACENNEGVARRLGLPQTADLWRLVRLLFADPSSTTAGGEPQPLPQQGAALPTLEEEPSAVAASVGRDEDAITRSPANATTAAELAGTGDEPTDTDLDDFPGVGGGIEQTIDSIASGLASTRCDFFFGDGEVNDPGCLDYDGDDTAAAAVGGGGGGGSDGDVLTLPTEAFEVRHELNDDAPPPATDPTSGDSLAVPSTSRVAHPAASLQQLHGLLSSAPAVSVGDWVPWHLLAQLMEDTARNADMQTACTLLLVSLSHLPQPPPVAAEQWLLAYLDLLWRRRLWNTATRVISRAPFAAVRSLNHVALHISCGRCGRAAEKAGWWCRRCAQVSSVCVLCHRVVRGVRVWCQGCSHGGHLHHMSEWFARHQMCPSGCGHKCTPLPVGKIRS